MSSNEILQERNVVEYSDAVPQFNLAITSLVVLTIIAIVTVMIVLGPVVIPVLVAIFLFFIIRPVTNFMLGWHIPRWLTYVLIILALSGIIWLISHLIYVDSLEFLEELPQMQARAQTLLKKIPGVRPDILDSQSLTDFFNLQPGDVFQTLFGTAWHFTESVLMVLFYLVFVLMDADRLPHRIRIAFPRQGGRIVRGFDKISEGISRYMWVKTLISLGMGFTAGLILFIFGVSNWMLWAFLAFLLNYITYIGSLIALVPPAAIALLQFKHMGVWLGLVSLLCLNRFLWIDFLEIRFSGQQLRINNVLLLFSIVFWGWFWGVTGMVLAVPMISAVRIILAQFEKTRAWAILISED